MTGYQIEADVDLDSLDSLFRGPVVSRPVDSAAKALAPENRDIAPLDGEAWSTPISQARTEICGRIFRTLAPFVLSDMLALILAGLVTQWVMWLVWPPVAAAMGNAAPFAVLPLIVTYWLSDLYSEIWVHPVIEFRQLTHLATVVLLAAAAGAMMAQPLPLWFIAAWLPSAILVPLARNVARHLCMNRAWWGYPALIITSGDQGEEVANLLLDAPRCGLRPVLLTDLQGKSRARVVRVLNDTSALESVVRGEMIRHAVVALPDIPVSQLPQVLDRFSGLIPHLLVMSDSKTLPTLLGASRSFGGLSGLEVRNGLLMATLMGVKRFIDLVVAIAALSLSLPILLLVALAVKLSSRGPVFFGHTRIGLHGRRFKAWKFRTMYTNGDAILREHLAKNPAARAEWDADQKLRHDPRVTPIGNIIRKFSLDELPQIWNVLRGDMSIVGPRPIVQSEVERYGDVYRQYTTVKPGITGLWQVSGRNDINYEGRVLLDQFYIRHWSPWLDVYILAKTVVALVSRDGAY